MTKESPLSFLKTRLSRRKHGWPLVKIGDVIVWCRQFFEHSGQWPMLPEEMRIHVFEWSKFCPREHDVIALWVGIQRRPQQTPF